MEDKTTSEQRPSLVIALLILLGTFIFVALFLAIYGLVGVGVPYIGLLFLLYWAAIRHQDFNDYLPSVIGGVIGIVVGWMLVTMPGTLGQTGSIISYGALASVLFCFIRGQAKIVANHCTLLFMLVATIPELKVAASVVPMLESLLLAAAIMGLVSVALRFARTRR